MAHGSAAASRLGGHDAAAGVEVLCRAQWKPMVRLAYLLCGDQEGGAEDIVQDAFAALSRQWDQLRSDDAAGAYLRTAVVNGTRSAIRRRITARRLLHPIRDERVEAAESTAVRNDEQRRVLAVIRQLPRRQREVIVMMYWAGLSEAEIAATLGVSPGTVKTAAARAQRNPVPHGGSRCPLTSTR
ncbi:MAG TPA: sigma-70 family RNA polymerase sigma factor [Jatrophihabitantaceae bacterium]